MNSLPWVEKYRPKELNEIVSHQDIISTIKQFMDQKKLPHLLLYGPAGTGKTSTILSCARYIYGKSYKSMILELNASDDRGISVVRDEIKSFASTKSLFSSGFKLIILDEADALTTIAQNALRRIIEQYTKNVRFCIICNYVNKIIPAIQSRCTRFRFSPLKDAEIQNCLDRVIESEKVKISNDGKTALQQLSAGDMRKALNILQAAHSAHEFITEDVIYSTTGYTLPSDLKLIQNWIFNSDFSDAFVGIRALQLEKGLATIDIMTRIFRNVKQLDLPEKCRSFLYQGLSDIEYALSTGGSEKLQMSAMVGVFKEALELCP